MTRETAKRITLAQPAFVVEQAVEHYCAVLMGTASGPPPDPGPYDEEAVEKVMQRIMEAE